MFKRLRQLRISLAAKCQLLFGAAVTLIIAAALWVPWQRMDQLTDQLNVKAAQALANTAIGEHVVSERRAQHPVHSTGNATAGANDPMEAKAPLAIIIDGERYLPPRLVALSAVATPEKLTRFEAAALSRFMREPERTFDQKRYPLGDGREGYRYAQPLYARRDCLSCHADSAPAGVAATGSLMSAPPELNVEPRPSTDRAINSTGAVVLPSTSSTVASGAEPVTPRLLGLVSADFPSQIDSRQLLLNRVFLLTAGLLAGTLAIVIFYLITTRLILQPVRVLQETAEKVAQGDLNIRSDINTGDEFQQLSETFNVMLANLKKNSDQLRAVNKSLDLKLGQLAESNVALFESNRLKSEFLANVSHELRTPLNSILGFADLLGDQLAPAPDASTADAKNARYVQNIVSSGNNLLDLINDLLDLAKIEAGRMEVRSEPLSLSDLFEGLTNLIKPLAQTKQLTVVPMVAADVPILRTDPSKLQQILYNFLSNAIKFSPAGEEIELTAECDGEGAVCISVTDHGGGIAADQQAVIFEKFRQLDGSVTRQHSGTGLGLAISKELATLLGGSIKLRSAPDEGATFFLTLPLRIEAGTQDVRGRLVLT